MGLKRLCALLQRHARLGGLCDNSVTRMPNSAHAIKTATPSVLVMDETLSSLLGSINEGSPIACSLKTPIQDMGPTETHRMVQNLELALRSFQDHIHLRLSQYHSHQNAISPSISKLPVEIFNHILCLSVAIYDWSTVSDWSITRLKELAQVAKAWRDVILGTPEIWAVIKIHRRPSGNPQWRKDLKLVLARSRSAPLTVVYGVGREGYNHKTRDVDMGEVGEIFTLVGDHASRLQTMLYSGSLCPAVAAVLELPTPSLKHLDVYSWDYYDPQGTSMSKLPLRLLSGQKLFYVKVQNVPLIWGEFKGLTSLHLIKAGEARENGGLVEDVLSVLQSCPDLQSLTLENMGSANGGLNAGSPDERLIQDVLARSRQIDLSSLWSLIIKNSAPSLILAIVFSIHAMGVTNLHLEVGRYFLTALPDITAGQLIRPAFDRSFGHGPESRLHIVQHCHSLQIQNHGHESWEKQSPRKASFELQITADGGATEEEALENLYEFLECSSRPMPVQLELGFRRSPSENASCMIGFPVYILDQVVELRLNGSRTHTSEILLHLSRKQTWEGSDPEPIYPCPRLSRVWICTRKWKQVLNFLESRYGPRPGPGGSVVKPACLPHITFVQYGPTPDVLPRITPFVKRWEVVDMP
ncbi:hypothetical protein FRB95_006068 [Tulasnella sp. JGI-2019a]|nr:hypothetical protein FRB95_006068 [Tulasnella sp. JGI-2019a]